MEPSDEFLQLLREIRDAQREALALTRAWKDRSNEEWDEWKKRQDEYDALREKERQEYEAWRARCEADSSRWREANDLWLLQQRRGKYVGVVFLGFLLLGVTFLVIAAALGWLK